MGSLMSLIARGLAWGGPAALGYFFNDIGDAVSKASPNTNVRDTSGKFTWWFVAIIAIAGGLALSMVLNMFKGKRGKLFMLTAFAYGVDYFCFSGNSGLPIIAAGILGTIPASSAGSFTIDYLPEIITFTIATTPSKFQIEMKDDGTVFNLDTDGITSLDSIGFVDAVATVYTFRVANGYVLKTATFNITNAQAAVLTIRGFSAGKGDVYNSYQASQAFANVEFTLKDFGFASFPDAIATDLFTVVWASGKSDNVNLAELQALLSSTQNNVVTAIDNRSQIVSAIKFTGATTQNVYYTKLKAVG